MATRGNQTRKAGEPKAARVSDVVGTGPTIEERVRFQAYLLFEKRQHAGITGDAVSDWLRAERELSAVAHQLQKTRLV